MLTAVIDDRECRSTIVKILWHKGLRAPTPFFLNGGGLSDNPVNISRSRLHGLMAVPEGRKPKRLPRRTALIGCSSDYLLAIRPRSHECDQTTLQLQRLASLMTTLIYSAIFGFWQRISDIRRLGR